MYAHGEEIQLETTAYGPCDDFKNNLGLEYQYVRTERDLMLPIEKHKNAPPVYESPDEEISIRRYLTTSVGIASLIAENLLSHPFVVLRRQCQVYHASKKYHLQPFTLVPTIIHLNQRQGLTTLWKGLGSCLLVRGMCLAVEDVFSKFTPWPKEVNSRTSFKGFSQHILLKCVSIIVVMPFYSASLVETVQSSIASEKPGIFDIFREGINRIISFSLPQKGRMLPIWALIGPSVSLGLSKYIFGLIIKSMSMRILMYRNNDPMSSEQTKGARSSNKIKYMQNVEIYSNITSLIASEALFYPFETILHRIYLQGTRTIIDNLDNGYAVVPVLTSYEGAIDCYKTTITSEGYAGLYKGFGALLLQFAAHIAVIKLTKWIITQVTEVMSTKPPPKVVEYYNLEQMQHSDSTTISHSFSSTSNVE